MAFSKTAYAAGLLLLAAASLVVRGTPPAIVADGEKIVVQAADLELTTDSGVFISIASISQVRVARTHKYGV